jgi:hypothetical protein
MSIFLATTIGLLLTLVVAYVALHKNKKEDDAKLK